MAEFSLLIARAEKRMAENVREKDRIIFGIGELDGEMAKTTRVLAEMEIKRAAAQFARPRTAELDADLKSLNYYVSTLTESLKALQRFRLAYVLKVKELDERLQGDRCVVQFCSDH
ncbi:hypothetical protein VFPPC_12468 [Pochonia chlamydosporia 170]|uniref:Uncharacterized protein n=1 Tax=Pochonia chlamydosporia 170 TaxID=1380566 RepID=A0A179EWK0_METCM|nr:hypothetical protein VFPPC_12468 [Pochonia chlamydosporia 170]OAQ57400.1 hypothetical protein VFPPC_12468 [Pochonia chlamydosporia 170]